MVLIRAFLCLLAALPLLSAPNLQEAFRNGTAVDLTTIAPEAVNVPDSLGDTPLHYAVLYGTPEQVKALLDRGADPKLANKAGATPLLWAVGDLKKVRLLLAQGADVNAVAQTGRTALLAAVTSPGAIEVVRTLLAAGANVNTTNKRGRTALIAAAGQRDPALVKLLIEKGANVNGVTEAGFTPLLQAAGETDVRVVRMLLDAGAKVNVQSAKGSPAALGEFTPLLVAAANGVPEIIRLLLEKGADVHARDQRGMTALMLAASAESRNTEVIRLLLDKGADRQMKSTSGETALEWAQKWNDPAVSKVLGGANGRAIVPVLSEKPPGIREAVSKSIGLLQVSAAGFSKKAGCGGCHHTYLTPMTLAVARSRGFAVDEEKAAQQSKLVVGLWKPVREQFLQKISPPGGSEHTAFAALALAAIDHQPDTVTDAMFHDLATSQEQDGYWHTTFNRPPMEYTDYTRTALAIRVLDLFAPPSRRAEADERIARARRWLSAQKPSATEERAMHLLGLAWSKADRNMMDRTIQTVIQRQRPDGGWSQIENWESDAYATGEVLYALHAAGLPASDAAYRRGVNFLLRTQSEDGSWHVRSRSVGFQPYFESGYPYAHDQWISAAGAAWSTMALMYAAEPVNTAATSMGSRAPEGKSASSAF